MKHKEIAKAWLDGAEVQIKNTLGKWVTINPMEVSCCCPDFGNSREYRLKPVDQVLYGHIDKELSGRPRIYSASEVDWSGVASNPSSMAKVNAKMTFDAETGELKALEFLK